MDYNGTEIDVDALLDTFAMWADGAHDDGHFNFDQDVTYPYDNAQLFSFEDFTSHTIGLA